MKKSSNGLILSSIVAVVALVGIVMMFGSHMTGAAISYQALACPGGTWTTMQYEDAEGRARTTNIICVGGTSSSIDKWTAAAPGVSWDNNPQATAGKTYWWGQGDDDLEAGVTLGKEGKGEGTSVKSYSYRTI